MTKADDARRVAAALGPLLVRANRAHLYDTVIGSASGVDEATYPVLAGLARLGPSTATDLAEAVGLDRTVTTRYASRLEQAGLVARRPHQSDARATTLRLTDRGRRTVEAMRRRLDDTVLAALSGAGAGQLTAFADLFEQLVAGLTAADD